MTDKIAFIFPGQGSQEVGMGQDVAQNYPSAKALFQQADDILGFPLSELCWHGPAEALNQTYNTQAAIYVSSLACLAALKEAGYTITPHFTAGHSMGEYVAYVVAGVLNFADGLKLVRERGRLMAEAGEKNPGKMAAILKLSDEAVADICRQASDSAGWVQIANFNSPGQVIISGSEAGVNKAVELAKAAGARRAQVLAVSIAAHSTLMESANAQFQKAVQASKLSTPNIPVIANISAQPLQAVSDIQAEMVGQLTASVQWTKSVEYMIAQGVNQFIEIGPGNVLTGLVKRINRNVARFNIQNRADIESLLQEQNND